MRMTLSPGLTNLDDRKIARHFLSPLQPYVERVLCLRGRPPVQRFFDPLKSVGGQTARGEYFIKEKEGEAPRTKTAFLPLSGN